MVDSSNSRYRKITGISRNQIIEALEKEKILSLDLFGSRMHMQPLYKKHEYVKVNHRDVSAELFQNGICLPSRSIQQKRIKVG